MQRYLLAVLAGLSLAATGASARAASTIDFESFRVEDDQLHDHPGVLEFDGFRITAVPQS